jgi:hypothetical protein
MLKNFLFQSQNEEESSSDGVILYNLFQIIAFTVMTVLIMRLKLFWTPHLCVFASFIANNSPNSILNFVFRLFDKLSHGISQNNAKIKMGVIVFVVGPIAQIFIIGNEPGSALHTMLGIIKFSRKGFCPEPVSGRGGVFSSLNYTFTQSDD